MISAKCTFFYGPENQLGKFRMGGYPEGTADIYDDHITMFKKGRGATVLFGAIGSALSGKGKEDISVSKSRIASYRSNNDAYVLYLTDGNVLFINLMGFSNKPAKDAMVSFLSGIPVKA